MAVQCRCGRACNDCIVLSTEDELGTERFSLCHVCHWSGSHKCVPYSPGLTFQLLASVGLSPVFVRLCRVWRGDSWLPGWKSQPADQLLWGQRLCSVLETSAAKRWENAAERTRKETVIFFYPQQGELPLNAIQVLFEENEKTSFLIEGTYLGLRWMQSGFGLGDPLVPWCCRDLVPGDEVWGWCMVCGDGVWDGNGEWGMELRDGNRVWGWLKGNGVWRCSVGMGMEIGDGEWVWE